MPIFESKDNKKLITNTNFETKIKKNTQNVTKHFSCLVIRNEKYKDDKSNILCYHKITHYNNNQSNHLVSKNRTP